MSLKLIEDKNLPDRVPLIKTRPGNFISPEFRASHDKWLEDTFGTTPYVLKMGDTIFASPAIAAAIGRNFQ